MLRHWQSECINLALNKYLQGQTTLSNTSDTWGRKTFMPASLSKKMFDANLIAFNVHFLMYCRVHLMGKLEL